MIKIRSWRFLSLFLLVVSAKAMADIPHFIFTLPVKKIQITHPDMLSQGIYSLTLYGVDSKVSYYMYPPAKGIGFVRTSDFLGLWKSYDTKFSRPLFAVIKKGNKSMLVALMFAENSGTNKWVFNVTEPPGKSSQHGLKLKPGTYKNAVILSDMLPVDILSIPHSVCALKTKLENCKSKPIPSR